MEIAGNRITVEMTFEEAKVITKMIGPTSFKSRKKDFGLTHVESSIAVQIYNVLSGIVGDNDD